MDDDGRVTTTAGNDEKKCSPLQTSSELNEERRVRDEQ